MGDDVRVGSKVRVGDGVAVRIGVRVGVEEGVSVAVDVGVNEDVGVPVFVWVGVCDNASSASCAFKVCAAWVASALRSSVADGIGVLVAVCVGDGVEVEGTWAVAVTEAGPGVV